MFLTNLEKNPIAESTSETHLSIFFLESLFLSIVLILSVNALLTVIAQATGIPFRNYCIITLLLTIACIFITAFIMKNRIKPVLRKDPVILASLFLLGSICMMVPLFTLVNVSGDDYFYVPNAVYFLDHPAAPMDFEIHYLIDSPDRPIVSHSQATSLAFEYFRSVISYYANIEYIKLYYLSGCALAFLIPLAIFLLLTRFSDSTSGALMGTLISMALIFISINGKDFGFNAFWLIHQGKRFVLVALMPLFAAYSISFFIKPNIINWISLLASATTMAGMTSSSVILLPILALLLAGASVSVSVLDQQRAMLWKAIPYQVVYYFSSLMTLFIYGLYLCLQVHGGESTADPLELPGWDFQGSLERFYGAPSFPITPILMVICPILLAIVWKGWQSRFILFWWIIFVVFFFNPLSGVLLIDRLIPGNIYWRLLYLTPYPLAAGLLINRIPISIRKMKITSMIAFIGSILLYFTLIHQQGILMFSIYDVPKDDLGIAKQITREVPSGVMLAPPNLYGLIPMVDGFHPQIRTRHGGNRFWLSEADMILREGASEFAGGRFAYIQAFEELLQTGLLKTIVLREEIFAGSNAEKVKSILREYGFVYQKRLEGYRIFWK